MKDVTTLSQSSLTGTNFIKPSSVSVNTNLEPQTGSERDPTLVREQNEQNRDEAGRSLGKTPTTGPTVWPATY